MTTLRERVAGVALFAAAISALADEPTLAGNWMLYLEDGERTLVGLLELEHDGARW